MTDEHETQPPATPPPPDRAAQRRRNRLVLAIIIAAVPATWLGLNGLGTVLEDTSAYPGPKRFAAVQDGVLYRSGMLEIGDFARLVEANHIKTVLCVRGGASSPLQNAWYRRETAYCADHGVKFVHAPMTSANSERNVRGVKTFWEIIDDPANYPVLVHCEAGVDRTGVLSYLYRIYRQGWPEAKARKELMDAGASKRRIDPIIEQLGALDPPFAVPDTMPTAQR